ncbi:MAG: L-2-hydroxyglutarate oxidase, partial [Planctomycetes bacterium]|nr:L-2-hydroxyglutarate oxidase [Planctomycetota bacterium]
QSNLVIVGGGIVGLATAYRFLERFPGRTLTVLEKESSIAQHQTGRNSGVLHSGIYYRPGSLKARNCRVGKLAMEEFCRHEGIPFKICGKVIVAIDESELPRLEQIIANGRANGVACERIDIVRLRELEPHTAGIAAIHVPEAGIVDYGTVAKRLAEIVEGQGGKIVTDARVTAIRHDANRAIVVTTTGEFSAEQVVNCAGLFSDRVTRLSGAKPAARIVPFRGEYYRLRPEAEYLVRTLIYPVPDPRYPFLGIHFTRRFHGQVECGPNAVLAFAREGYRNTLVNPRDLAEALTYPAFWKLAVKYWRTGADEMWRSFSKRAFVRAAQRLVPEVKLEHFEAAPAGVRAQAISPDGSMVDDFLVSETDRVVNVENAPSPAATASLNIGRLVVDRIAPRFE